MPSSAQTNGRWIVSGDGDGDGVWPESVSTLCDRFTKIAQKCAQKCDIYTDTHDICKYTDVYITYLRCTPVFFCRFDVIKSRRLPNQYRGALIRSLAAQTP